MCGFVGMLNNNYNTNRDISRLNDSLELIHHRGPDGTGVYENDYVYLGFKRLSIIDIENGGQPLGYKNRYQIVFNGEIYNYLELRDELKALGYTFETATDTEVILALYDFRGKDCVKQLRGMFAFAIWDEKEHTLFAARDPFGIKPFYYYDTKDHLIFSSEQKCIAYFSNRRNLSQESLQHYLSYQYVPEPYCLSKDIYKLRPGHYLVKKPKSKAIIEAFDKKSFFPSGKSVDDYIRLTREALEDSVEKHLRSDVPVGAFLSSGIDSTTIVALAKRHNPNLKTFTVGFEVEGFSEIHLAKETADQLGVENIHKLVSPDEFIKEIKTVIWYMDDPVADPASIPLYFVAKEASKHVKVVLSGEGADELFGGYNIYREPVDLRWFQLLPGPMKKAINKYAQYFPDGMKGKNYLLRGTTPLEQRYIGNAFIFTEKEKENLLKNYVSNTLFTNITESLYKEAKLYTETSRMQYVDLNTWLPGDILVKADRMTMAHSLELRVPFLDQLVFEVAKQIPDIAKISHRTTKYVLRQSVKDIVPENILFRKKLGFPVPIRQWLRNELYDWAKGILQSNVAGSIFKKEELLLLLEEHVTLKRDNSRKLWTILTFLIWKEQNIQQEKETRLEELIQYTNELCEISI